MPGAGGWNDVAGASSRLKSEAIDEPYSTNAGLFFASVTIFCLGWGNLEEPIDKAIFSWTFGKNEGDEEGDAVYQTADGGYNIAGSITLHNGDPDIWLIKTDSNGAEE